MNEIELSGLGRSAGVEKPVVSATSRKDVSPPAAVSAQDTVELSDLPDLSSVEVAVEQDFAKKTKALEGALANSYPPLDTIDRVAAMLAGTLGPSSGTDS